ncbi:hypothetical protein O6H91_15G047800 [Diphasiastrum complanatum]|uniref:Uncharacterized protein n=1 Tax=Diphasiastrum complanatum TaxID=34168 RepID=A0ACC2BJ02_DIPCM|nr:hypothetical protein O6H91_15G047800 [Diphasiastrum complanatum]
MKATNVARRFGLKVMVLSQLHKFIIPNLSSPILLSDFLTKSYNLGGLISVMALNGLFILISKYGLEYPDFYNKLYALLEPSIFVAKHRARFFELLDTCLKSSHLPAYLAAAFAKKLGRIALFAPPAGGLVAVAIIHNLLRRHPSINCLVHRHGNAQPEPLNAITQDSKLELDGEVEAQLSEVESEKNVMGKLGADPFKATESDTASCDALKSSLWEIETLRRHYCPAVSRFVSSLETDLTVRSETTEVAVGDFSSGSYSTIFSEEVGKRLKLVPLAFYETIPSSLFPEQQQTSPALNDSSDCDFLGWNFTESVTPEHEFSGGNTEKSCTKQAVYRSEENNQITAKNEEIENIPGGRHSPRNNCKKDDSNSEPDVVKKILSAPLRKKKRVAL